MLGVLQFDCQLKMQANVDRFNGDKYEAHVNSLLSAMGSSLLTNMRKYLTILAKIDYKLSPSMQKVIDAQFETKKLSCIVRSILVYSCVISVCGRGHCADSSEPFGVGRERQQEGEDERGGLALAAGGGSLADAQLRQERARPQRMEQGQSARGRTSQ